MIDHLQKQLRDAKTLINHLKAYNNEFYTNSVLRENDLRAKIRKLEEALKNSDRVHIHYHLDKDKR